MTGSGAAYGSVAAVGILVGAVELASRYRDQPQSLTRLASAWMYVFVNAAVSALALLTARTFDWTFGIAGAGDRVVYTQVIICGFGAMAVFRSGFAQIKVGDNDVTIGPAAVLATLLAMIDREVDRRHGGTRSTNVIRIMRNVDFDRAYVVLPTFCLTLLQNLPADEQEELSKAVKLIAVSEMSGSQKSLILGLHLMKWVGPELLASAVEALGSEIAIEASGSEIAGQAAG
jgi:hypothetical protein